jgi:methyl-accepting chemotaxis protein
MLSSGVCRTPFVHAKPSKEAAVALDETLKALENIVDRMDEILDALKESVSLMQEISQSGGDLGQVPNSVLVRLREVVTSLDALPWILSETGLEMLMAPFQDVSRHKLN